MPSKPSKFPIGYVNIRVFAHATEDQERVVTALRNTLPEELRENMVLKKTGLEGHHGNPITLIEAELADRETLMAVLENLGKRLTSLDKETLSREMLLHLEKGNLFLRLDKQQAYLGHLRVSPNDPLHFKVHFRNKTNDEIIAICKEAGLLP